MYVLATHIPVYVDGEAFFTDASWLADVLLARDWLARAFGGLVLVAPSLPLRDYDGSALRLEEIGGEDGICVVPSFDHRCRAREFWLRQRRQWVADLRRELRGARVLHSSASGDLYRPLAFIAHRAGVRAGVTTVFVGPDMDLHVSLGRGSRARAYCALFDMLMRDAMASADLALLKEGCVYRRYAGIARNPRSFCHSMHSAGDVIAAERLEARLADLAPDRPLRAAYAGRFESRKGLRDALAAVALARRGGASVTLELYGTGPEAAGLQRLARALGVDDIVHFHGVVPYGPTLFEALARCDFLLFMPTQEDTPRMLFDAMACGLPLLGTRVPFLEQRVAADRIGELVPIGDQRGAADWLCRFQREPGLLKALARAARAAGVLHARENWYHRRAQWTLEAARGRDPSFHGGVRSAVA
jgi:glycosyltransferase involved in cell wall biosynthesis